MNSGPRKRKVSSFTTPKGRFHPPPALPDPPQYQKPPSRRGPMAGVLMFCWALAPLQFCSVEGAGLGVKYGGPLDTQTGCRLVLERFAHVTIVSVRLQSRTLRQAQAAMIGSHSCDDVLRFSIDGCSVQQRAGLRKSRKTRGLGKLQLLVGNNQGNWVPQ